MMDISPDEIRKILVQLDQAIYTHNQWYDYLLRNLVCNLLQDSSDMEEDAHRKCRFGQWYYMQAPDELKSHPGFIAMEAEHERMHQLAAKLLATEAAGEIISLIDYENFNHSINTVRLQLQTLKHEMEDSLYNHDTLTHAYSRIGMLTRLRELQDFVKRNVQSSCIVMMDLDHFKLINDDHGHQAGDQVLIFVARHIMEHIRPYDKLFRYGGEEFLISMPHTDLKTGFTMIERLREEIAAHSIYYNHREMHITISFGLTLLDPDVTVEQSIERADRALYAAKAAGRNCTQIWNPSLDT
ncbi:MAG TPA: diguanylate cyclase, partial [Syntrophales bacterium]|nr:diguanylate cyclase [Syntrophales bacterium]